MKYSIIISVFVVMTLAGFIILPGLSGSKHDDSVKVITVFAASSLADVLEYLVVEFEHSNGVHVNLDFSSSGLLRAKITAGAEADAFLSASVKDMDLLQYKGFIAGKKRRDLLTNSLVCVVPVSSKQQIASPDDLLDERVCQISIGDPEHVPAGIYTREALITMGLWNKLISKLVPCADVRSTLAHAELGTVEAAT